MATRSYMPVPGLRKTALLLLLFLPLLFCSTFSCRERKPDKENLPYASLIDSTRYVGMDACKNCHYDKFETFTKTGMGLSFDAATRAKSSARFSDTSMVRDAHRNLLYHPHWLNDSLHLTEFRLSGSDTLYKREETINWIVGSGQHTNSHLLQFNGYLYQAPVTFYTQSQQWDLPPGFEGGYNSRFARAIGLECMTCHNAYPDIVQGSENKFTRIPNGIDCERCHGPGSAHVANMLAAGTVDSRKEIDYSIVNPAKLPIQLQLDICQRCHIQGNAVLKEGKSFFDFRPGMKLSDVMNVYMPLFKDDDSHIMASHAERMKMSKCFTVSLELATARQENNKTLTPYKDAMTCVTCHDPHVSSRFAEAEQFNAQCLNCHSAGEHGKSSAMAKTFCSATESVRLQENNNCIKCHMPRNSTIDIPHVVTTDHYIRIPVKESDVKRIKEFAGLICINNHEDDDLSRGIAFLSYFEKFSSNPAYLDSAKNYLRDDGRDAILQNFRHLVRWAFLKRDYEKVIDFVNAHGNVLDSLHHTSYSNDDAWTAYRIGDAYYETGDLESAIVYFQRGTELAPYLLDFRNKLSGAQFDAGRLAEAREGYHFIIREQPKYVSAYVSLGYLLLRADNDVSGALRLFDSALALDPDQVQAMINKAGILLYQNNEREAVRLVNRVLQIDPSNRQALELRRRLVNP